MDEKNEKLAMKISIISTVLVIIVIIIVIIRIWFPSESVNNIILSFDYDNEIDYKQKGYEYIYSDIRSLLYENNTSLLFEKMDEEFLEDNSLNEENFKDYVVKNQFVGKNVKFLSYDYYENGDNVTYIIKYTLNTSSSNIPQTKTVYVLEEAPFKYTLSFTVNSIPTKDDLNIDIELQGIKFVVSLIERQDNYLRFALKLVNVSNSSVEIDFRNLSSVQLLLDDKTKVKMTSIAVTDADKVTLSEGSYINKELVFPINIENQGKIKEIVFPNLKIDSKLSTISIEF